MRARSLYLYPFLLAAWPPLALAAKNSSAVFHWQQLAVPIAAGCAVAGLAWAVAAACRLEKSRGPAVAAGAALAWWSYGALVSLVRYSPVIRSLGLPHMSGWIVAALLLRFGSLLIHPLPAGLSGADRGPHSALRSPGGERRGTAGPRVVADLSTSLARRGHRARSGSQSAGATEPRSEEHHPRRVHRRPLAGPVPRLPQLGVPWRA